MVVTMGMLSFHSVHVAASGVVVFQMSLLTHVSTTRVQKAKYVFFAMFSALLCFRINFDVQGFLVYAIFHTLYIVYVVKISD